MSKNILLMKELRKYWIDLCSLAITQQEHEKRDKIFKIIDKLQREKQLTNIDEVFLKSIENELKKY